MILFLIPPSEWKNPWWVLKQEILSFVFKKPKDIAVYASEKDLKCKWDRFNEWILLNKNIDSWLYMEAINRYWWVMYNTIAYNDLSNEWQSFFDNNFLILSWMYWIVRPKDCIWNYKLPIETKWLYSYWWSQISDTINKLEPDYVVNLLPVSYQKMIVMDRIKSKVININFLTNKDWRVQKISHWVKKLRWNWVNKVCNNQITDIKDFWWEISECWRDVNILL